ncbi:hypothetical protein HBI56_061180 [Parastagonospora nodorum]|nr:hypothetical protein HBI09_083710 [Parastagonospora nodorum]KAH4347382.1 hypothetical protein HBH98_092710 [Parastagonospora nodorum]KAH4388915.1 hypothetical protein HBH97_054700 [Parastagonospora nodorum]KAH4396742.1 hypothetical protein HBH99_121930 [Parastagonospora nodorum]KAH4931230.1 hypothetical protein HBI79_110040 [Parastagonospora nodorum]
MPTPSYARATTSSSSKATSTPNSPLASKSKDNSSSPSTPRRLKRPSTLTPSHRLSISYKSDLYPILPLNPNKPSPLALLPSELRTTIYQYILAPDLAVQQPRYIHNPRLRKTCYIFPPLLHISRAIRIEAAYEFYTTTPFTFSVRNLDFGTSVVAWLTQLPAGHRALLTRNRNLRIRMMPGLRPSHTYPPPGWVLDGWLQDHWGACAGLGNLYAVKGEGARVKFLLFCRLLGWFQSNAMMYRGMRWRYEVDCGAQRSIWDHCGQAETVWRFLSEEVGVLGMGGVARAWKRDKVKGKGREEALKFLDDLDNAFARAAVDGSEDLAKMWASEMTKLKEVVNRW